MKQVKALAQKDSALEKELITIVLSDSWMMETMRIVQQLNLNDCWIGAGFIRNKIWDHKHNIERTPLNDIDIIYFDNKNAEKTNELRVEDHLKEMCPNLNWSVKNQARMHIRNGHSPYASCKEALCFWPETATAIAIRLNKNQEIECIAPYGLTDLFELIVRPTPNFDRIIHQQRVEKKNWMANWPLLIREDQ